jgi:hypothetical protein
LRRIKASLRLGAQDGVGVGDNTGRFLRQEVEERVGKEKTPNPQKQKNKSVKQTRKEGE